MIWNLSWTIETFGRHNLIALRKGSQYINGDRLDAFL